MKTYIGIDNGVSGTIGIISEKGVSFLETPSKVEQSYTKKKGNITRIDFQKLYILLKGMKDCHVMVERPMVNPARFKATVSALRAMEATLIVLEILKMPYEYIDSKEWQKALLPQGIKGEAELKKASVDIGRRLFPQHENLIVKHKDADGLLIAEYCKRNR